MNNISEKNLIRIKRSKLNTTVAITTSILMGVLSFAERTIFNHTFSADYLGLYSFYDNIMGVLCFVELGITGSIAFALYAPLEYKEYDQIAAIMRFFKRTYFAIGCLILFVGMAIIPILPNLVKTSVPIIYVQIYYIFFLLRTAFNYWFGYQNILLSANQEQYIVTLVTNIAWTLLYAIDITIELLAPDFLYYSIAYCGINFLRLIILNIIGRKEFKNLKNYKSAKIKPEIKKHIIKNTKGVIMSKLGTAITQTTDSILISSMVGTAVLGQYSNYQMLVAGLRTVTYILPSSITASIGNAGVTESRRTMLKSFEILNLASFFIYGPVTIVIINIANPIINTFFGADKVMPILTVFLIFTNFYINNLRQILSTYRSSFGLFWYDRKRTIIEGLVNLIVSLILGNLIGIDGIIIGTIVSNITVNLVIEPRNIIHIGLKSSVLWYYLTVIGRMLMTFILTVICLYFNHFIPFEGLIGIIIKALTSAGITLIAFFIVYRKNPHTKTIIETLKIAMMSKKRLKRYKEKREAF